MKRPVDKKKKRHRTPASETATEVLCSTAAKRISEFYQRWSKAARKHSGRR